jgi:hypothetical protein
MYRSSVIPSFVRRGGCASKKNGAKPPKPAQTGWSLTSRAFVLSDHPVRSTKEASRHFLDVAATPPHEEGIQLCPTFFDSFHTALENSL